MRPLKPPAPEACPVLPLRVTVLVENTSRRTDLVGEHGFAALLETPAGVTLFDTGATAPALARNAQALGADLARVGAIVLSHGHYDHTGGLAAALTAAPGAKVYHHWRTTARRWGRRLGLKKSIGMSAESLEAMDAAARCPIDAPAATPEGLLLSGPIPGPASAAQKGFLEDSDGGPKGDDFADEMFALARTPAGWVLVTGCCHRGLGNTLAHGLALTGGGPIRTVLGGFHLKRVPRRHLDAAARALEDAGTREVLAGHCTGDAATAYLASRLPGRVEAIHVGFTRAW